MLVAALVVAVVAMLAFAGADGSVGCTPPASCRDSPRGRQWVRSALPCSTSSRAGSRGSATLLGVLAPLTGLALGAPVGGLGRPFLPGHAIADLSFGPPFGVVFRALSAAAPADQRAGLISSILAVS